MVELYDSYNENKPITLKPLPLQYSDYSIWQRDYLQGEILEKKLEYWKLKLEEVTPLQLPTDYPRPAVQSKKGAITGFTIDKETSAQLQLLSQQQGGTLFMIVLSAINVLLSRYSSQQDICIGIGVAGRQHQELESLVGFFVNTLALRSQVNPESSFIELFQQVRSTTLEAYANQDVPFEKVVDAVGKERDMSRTPLFQVMFSWQNTPEVVDLRLGELNLSRESFEQTTSRFDLTFTIGNTPFGLHGSLEYCSDLFSSETMERMLSHFKQLLSSIVRKPEQRIGDLEMLTAFERQQLLFGFNDTSVEYPKDKSIIDLFEEQVVKTPGALALVFEDRELSYKELNEHSNQLAHYLRSRGVREETLVPVCIDRSTEMLICILGILKAGGAYVPIDIDYPLERISYILEDTEAAVVIINRKNTSKLPFSKDLAIIEIDAEWEAISRESAANLEITIEPFNLAYVIYTSGSTGKPKGVLIEHKGVVNLSLSQLDALRLKPDMKTLQFASFGFDASCYEIFNTLLSGGSLVLPTKEDLLSSEAFEKLVNKHKVEVVVLPPSYQHIIKDSLGTIKTIVSAGEPLNEAIGRYIQSKGIRLVNAYGPTENTVCATLTDNPLRENNSIVIGKPISNVQVYILDKTHNLSPIGTIGEIHLAGAQVARGYLNRAELTAENFIIDPFSNEPGARMYRTEDLGRWLPDGNIEYQGRIDDQVKIRGYRIELGEIEAVLVQSGLVNQAVVLAKDDTQGHKRLIGYIVVNGLFEKQTITSYLHSKLPDYMVPSLWVELQSVPLTPNGKIDKKALPECNLIGLTNEHLAPRNQMEQQLLPLKCC